MRALTTTGTILAGTAAAFIAVMGAAGGAEAKGKGKHVTVKIGSGYGYGLKHHRHRHLYFAGPVLHDGCGYEKRMWWKTGSYYWKKEYYVCKGWW